jgi:glycerate kinase
VPDRAARLLGDRFARVLVAPSSFGDELGAPVVAAAVARGLHGAGWATDELPVEDPVALADPGFARRLRAARAVVVGAGTLDRAMLRGAPAGEIAVRARQAGVPCHAVTARNALDPFEARILDLQVVLEAADAGALEAAGRELGRLI